jgi:linoleoyl-CoA desaturase
MKTIRFESSSTLENEFAVELRNKVNAYFTENKISPKANAEMVWKTVVMISLYVVPFLILMMVPVSIVLAVGLVVVMGIGIAGVGMCVMHDACHGAYSSKKWVNDLLSGTLYLLGSNVLNWKLQHNVLHHSFTNLSGLDEDINAKGPIRLSKSSPYHKYQKFQYVYAFLFYGLMTFTMLVNEFTRLIQYNREGLIKGQHTNLGIEYAKMLGRKVLYIFVIIGLPILYTDFTWVEVLVGFFIMHWVAGIILSFTFQMAHVVEGAEQPSMEVAGHTNWYVHQLKTTADFARDSRLLSWYVGGLNFQIEHHLFQNICHVHYRKIAPIVERLARQYGLPYNLKPSFAAALSSHIQMLKYYGNP